MKLPGKEVNPPLCACGCGEEVGWHKRRKKWNIYICGHNWKGHKHTKKTKMKISISNAGRKVSEETRRKISIIHAGKRVSEETGRKISIVKTGSNTGPDNPNWKGGVDNYQKMKTLAEKQGASIKGAKERMRRIATGLITQTLREIEQCKQLQNTLT